MQADLPFTGLRILDLSQGIAGPYCTQMLWQQGADVVKVEPPQGDWGRHVGVTAAGHSALSVSYNAGKRSLCVDARVDSGRALLRRLASGADIVVQNFRPGVAERMGMGYDVLAADVPGLIYVSISGYGEDGPCAQAPASDSVMQADSGLMFANQDEHGMPRRVGILLADIATALYAAQQTSAALYRRALTGQGAHVRLSLFEACAALQINDIAAYAHTGSRRAEAVSAPNGVFDTADGRISVLALNDDQFGRLCRALGREAWLDDPRFAGNALRMAQRDVLHGEIAAQLSTASTASWVARFAQHDVLHAPVRDYAQLADHPQAGHLGVFQDFAQPGWGMVSLPGLPGTELRRPMQCAPAVGEHTLQILQEAGLARHEIDELLGSAVVRQAEPAIQEE
ncbi:CoA transferase [Pusillimonas sp. TS35]|uniref:CaiB/BaiF CoA transferase family protein n=1 Tax=Paracandidimonas lactea TaxID=2895524 RepID=UPI00136B46D6|nr:CoA transferase [Paracandidimonas lactea]MYN13131.1 CoA transferase [Pusillimonas sp. TS35]